MDGHGSENANFEIDQALSSAPSEASVFGAGDSSAAVSPATASVGGT
jgi:hypothetical protein